jgi:CheY-like chemotaxis protein
MWMASSVAVQLGIEDSMKTLLFVDDDTGFRELCRRVFEEEGYGVVLAEDGTAALETVAAGQPDVAILDVRMPEMSGIELAEELKAIAPELPIIFYTGCDDMCTMDCRCRLAAACIDKNRGFTDLAMAVTRVLSAGGGADGFRLGLPPLSSTVV